LDFGEAVAEIRIETAQAHVVREDHGASPTQEPQGAGVVLAVSEADEDGVVAAAEPVGDIEFVYADHPDSGWRVRIAERCVGECVDSAQLPELAKQAKAVIGDPRTLWRQRRDIGDAPRPAATRRQL